MKVVSQEKQSSRKRKFQNYTHVDLRRRKMLTFWAGWEPSIYASTILRKTLWCRLYGAPETHQVETVPGPKPRRGPPPATGTSDPKHLAGKGQSKATGYNLRLCHWNAEGIRPKKLEIHFSFKSKKHRNVLHSRNSSQFKPLLLYQSIWDIQKRQGKRAKRRTNSGKNKRRKKGLGIKLLLEGNPLSIYNLYSPPPKILSLHNIKKDGS